VERWIMNHSDINRCSICHNPAAQGVKAHEGCVRRRKRRLARKKRKQAIVSKIKDGTASVEERDEILALAKG